MHHSQHRPTAAQTSSTDESRSQPSAPSTAGPGSASGHTDASILHELVLSATDGYPLAVDLIMPPPSMALSAIVIMAPAMAVKRTFYRPFGRYLAAGGAAVLCPDYRGIGGSRPEQLRGFDARIHEWVDLDLAAIVQQSRPTVATHAITSNRNADHVPLCWAGHSLGGQLLGTLRKPTVERALFIASAHADWRHWPKLQSLVLRALWHVIMPAMVKTAGFLPMRAFRQGENLPAGIGLDWAHWGREPNHLFDWGRARNGNGFDHFAGPLRAYAFADDPFAPPAAVEALLAGYRTEEKEVCHIRPADVGRQAIGHFTMFRPWARTPLWSDMRAWLLQM